MVSVHRDGRKTAGATPATSSRQRALNRVLSKHFDFVLCAQNALAVVCVVELDDRSHRSKRRQERDAFLASACKAAGLPLLQIPARRAYSVPEVRASVLEAVGALSQVASVPQPSPPTGTPPKAASELDDSLPRESPRPPLCPKCSSEMVLREAKSGTNVGGAFWGCSRFPKCRSIVAVDVQPVRVSV